MTATAFMSSFSAAGRIAPAAPNTKPEYSVAERWNGTQWVEVKLFWNGTNYQEVQ